MVEAIPVISFVSAIASLIDTSYRVANRLKDFQSKAHDIPQTLQHVNIILSITISGLEPIRSKDQAGTLDSDTQKALRPAVDECDKQVRRLEEILGRVLPVKEDSCWEKTKKALRSLSKDKEVQYLLKNLDRYLLYLIFHTTSTASTVGPQPMPVQQTIMIPARKDPKFVDRTDILREVESNLKNYGRAAITGRGGIGKTQIAIALCHGFLNDNPEGNIFWAHAGTLSGFVEACKIIAGELQLPGWNDPKVDTLHLLHQWLKNGQNGKWLFVLDGADDIGILEEELPSQYFSAGIEEFLPTNASGAILITTRDSRIGERLAVRAQTTTVPAMKMSEGSQLFSSYLPKELSTGSNSIKQLVDALEYLPLAITQAAAYITENKIDVEEYLSILQGAEVLELLELLGESFSDGRRSYTESNSVIKTCQLSFDSITKQDPRAAEILSLMATFDLQGIPATFLRRDDESKRVFKKSISTLLSFSLVAKATDGETYSMHRLVQLSAQAWLEQQNTTLRWRREALFTLARLFPSGGYDSWRACEALLPHTRVVLSHELQSSDCAMKRAELLQKLAYFDLHQGRSKCASSKAQEASEIFERFQGKNSPMVLSNMATVGSCLIRLDKVVEAEKLLQKNLTLQEQVLGSSHPETLRSMAYLAWAWYCQERYDEAESLTRETLTGLEQILGPNHPDTLQSMSYLSVILRKNRNLDEAETLCKVSLASRLRLWGPDHPDVLKSQLNLATILYDQDNHEAAELQLRLVLESRRRILGNRHPSTLNTMCWLAYCIKAQGKLDEAIALYHNTLNFEETALGGEHLDTIIARSNLAHTLKERGNDEEAARHFRIILALKASDTELSNPRVYEMIDEAEEELKSIERRLSRVEAEYDDDDYVNYIILAEYLIWGFRAFCCILTFGPSQPLQKVFARLVAWLGQKK